MQMFYKRSKIQSILNTSRLRWNVHEMLSSLHEKNALQTYLNINFVLGWIVNTIPSPSPLPNSRKQFFFCTYKNSYATQSYIFPSVARVCMLVTCAVLPLFLMEQARLPRLLALAGCCSWVCDS